MYSRFNTFAGEKQKRGISRLTLCGWCLSRALGHKINLFPIEPEQIPQGRFQNIHQKTNPSTSTRRPRRPPAPRPSRESGGFVFWSKYFEISLGEFTPSQMGKSLFCDLAGRVPGLAIYLAPAGVPTPSQMTK